MSETEVLDGKATEVEDPPDDDQQVTATVSTGEVVVRQAATPPSRQVLMPMEATDVVAGMKAYQELLPQLLTETDYQAAEAGKRFVKKSGFRKIARAFNLSVTIEQLHVERDEQGRPMRAECVARATAPNGQVQDGDGYCSADEFIGRRADSVKIENDLRTTATTRAKNRAISDLVGMGEVSAEEIDAGKGGPAIERASDEEQAKAKRALGRLVGGDGARAMDIYVTTLDHFDGKCPKGLAHLLIRLSEEPA